MVVRRHAMRKMPFSHTVTGYHTASGKKCLSLSVKITFIRPGIRLHFIISLKFMNYRRIFSKHNIRPIARS